MTYTNLHVKYPVHCRSVTNVYPSLQKAHAHTHTHTHTHTPPVRHEYNINVHTYLNLPAHQTLSHTHTNIRSYTEDTCDNKEHTIRTQYNKHTQIFATQLPEPHANKTEAKRKVAVTYIQEVTILQGFLPNTTRAFLFSRTRVTGVARITSLT